VNKLKENIFGIAVGGTVLGLLVLGYFLVFRPLQTLGERRAALDDKLKNLRTYNDAKKNPFVPTKAYADDLTSKRDADLAALSEGEQYYSERTKPFQLYFDDAATPPDPATFASRYQTLIDELVRAYREKAGISPAPDANPEEVPPKVSKIDLVGGIDEAKMAAAMKEFWCIQEIITACMDLGLGGLQSIDFPGRTTTDKYAHPYYGTVLAQVVIDLPFSKQENLLTKLLDSKRVPFVIEAVFMTKKPEELAKHQSLGMVKDFKQNEDPRKLKYEEIVPEPNVSVTIRLLGFDWKGIPKDEPKKDEK
jgi:hypothetical protein